MCLISSLYELNICWLSVYNLKVPKPNILVAASIQKAAPHPDAANIKC